MVPAPAMFKKAPPIEEQSASPPGSTALQHDNVYNSSGITEFIHFGRVHNDLVERFQHPSLPDDQDTKNLPTTTGQRAFMYRAALERETLLLDGYITSVQHVLEECAQSEGGVADLAGAVSSLAGGSAKNKPDPAQLDPYLAAVEAAGGKINVAAVAYEDIHKAGIDLHQARANFRAFVPSLAAGAGGGSGGGLLGNLPGALPLPPLPGVGDAIKTVQGILFKLFDIYKAMFLALREAYEPIIDDACYARSIEAIRTRYEPVFDVWSIKPPDAGPKKSEDKILDVQKTGLDAADSAVGDVNKGYSDAKREVDSVQQGWRDFWGQTPPEGPGGSYIAQAFAGVSKPEELMVGAFEKTLDVGELPGFVHTVLAELAKTNVGMLGRVYQSLQDPAAARQLDEQAFFVAGRTYLEGVLRELILKLVPAFSVGLPVGPKVDEHMVAGKAASFADELVGGKLDPILNLSMGTLHDELLAARLAADKSSAYTMEIYLARIPLLLALMTRNTFFPIWKLVIEKVFGTGSAVAGMLLGPVNTLMQSGRDMAADAKKKVEKLDTDIKNQAQDISSSVQSRENKIKDDLHAAHVDIQDSPVGKAAGAAADAVGKQADKLLGAPGADGGGGGGGGGAKFPGSPRLTSGEGATLKGSEARRVNAAQHVNAT